MTEPDGHKVRLNERLDHLQAGQPFLYNLVTGLLVGGVLWLVGVAPAAVAVWVVSWTLIRWFLWGDGRLLRRQYEVRQVRVAEQRAEKRRRRG
jgi:hypothetical protein